MDEYDGKQYVGIDLHRRRSVIVRMTPDGRRLGTVVRIDSDPFDLAEQVASWGESPEVVLEATYGWYWAADVLAEAGATVHLAHPLGVKGFAYRRVKNDERDAADLADLLRMGRLPEAWIAPPEVRGLREAIRHTGAKTKREAVVIALSEFNRRRRLRKLVESFGNSDEFMTQEELQKMREEA